MGKIPCRLCGSCGRYNDLSVQTCQCGADLANVPGRLVDEPIPPEQWGEINRSLPVFVQKCSACGAENFTTDPARPTRSCYNCHKARVALVVPIPYEAEQAPPDSREQHPLEAAPQPLPPATETAPDPGKDAGSGPWRSILESVQSCVPDSAPPVPGVESDDEDGEDAVSWDSLLGGGACPAQPPVGSRLTLTAIRYGPLSLTLQAGQEGLPFLLGRSAGCGEFLSQDLRVSNEHCYLTVQDGSWVVIDNHSANGTAVNRQFLDFNGQRILQDGDELTLGHHPDSMAFRVSIW